MVEHRCDRGVHVAVCLAAILDPDLPPGRLVLGDDGALQTHGLPRTLGPFDEAALEVALKLRDADPATRITAVMAGGAEDEPCLRRALGLRLDAALRVDIPGACAWDLAAVCRTLARALTTLDPVPDLVLLGRELSDRDDGVVPPRLAESLGWRFFGLVHRATPAAGLTLVRHAGTAEEQAAVMLPVVASVTNHPETRLRLPLVKNVVAAKRQPIAVLSAPAGDGAARVRLGAAEIVRRAPRGAGACRRLTGTPAEQASELARFLGPWRPRP